MSLQVSLVIKNPAKSGDFKCTLNLQGTRVIDLKNKLESEYDNHPAPDHQKIIFAGKLLLDNSLLADVLQQHDITIPQTFHLIVRPRTDPDMQSPPTSSHSPPANSSPQSTPPHPPHPPQSHQVPGPFYQYGAQGGTMGYGGYAAYGGQPGYIGYAYPGNMQHYPSVHNTHNIQPANNQFNNQFFPMHMNPQFRQFLQYQQQQHQLHQQTHSPQGQAPVQPQPQEQQQQQLPPQQQQQEQQQQQQQPEANQNNANGGNNISLLFKLAFLVLILSQGGDDERILVLCLVAVLVYLYQTGHIRLNRVNLFPQVLPQDPHNPQVQGGGIFREVALILTSFVYSLFPTWQPPTPNPNPNPGPEAAANFPPAPNQ